MNELFYVTGLIVQAAVPTAVVLGGIVIFSKTAVGRALVERLRARREPDPHVRQLADEVDSLREELMDVHERLDATERYIAATGRRADLPIAEDSTSSSNT